MPFPPVQGALAMTIDVEWSHPDVLADTVGLLDDRKVPATFFCTDAGIVVPGHERALHPNFRRSGNTVAMAKGADPLDDRTFYRAMIEAARELVPEATGVRSHSLITDSDLLPLYRDAGLEYDSSYMLPLAPGLAPASRGSGILEIPLYYMDHWDLREQATGFEIAGLGIERPGLKVFAFHPNLVFMNARTMDDVSAMRSHYHDPEWLSDHRREGRGVRTMFIELLDEIAARDSAAPLLAEVNASWRNGNERGP